MPGLPGLSKQASVGLILMELTSGVMSSLFMQFSTISRMIVSSAADTIPLPAGPAISSCFRRECPYHARDWACRQSISVLP
jgi:hypothetical protein